MASEWTTQRDQTIPLSEFHCVEGYRWSRLSLWLELGRNVPEYIEDQEIDDAVNKAWESRPLLCE